jgi:hypothetical protein
MSTTKYIVNNATGQTITGDITVNGNLNITGTTNTRPYKVYTALLTQSGGAGNQFIGGQVPGQELTIGVTYMINESFLGQDFTNVGAPNNNIGTWFVATGTIPNSWGENPDNNLIYYPGAPVAIVLENTIGNVWFGYHNVGQYTVNSDGLFTENKVWGTAYSGADDEISFIGFICSYNGESEIRLNSGNSSDNHLSIRLEIRVYN